MAFISRAQWGAAPPKSTQGWPVGKPDSTTVHWVGASGIAVRARYDATVKSIQAHAFAKGLSDIDYNFLVAPNGDIYEGRGAGVRSGAQHVGNATSLAVCYIEAEPLTAAAKQSIEWLNATHAKNGPIYPHNYWNQFTDKYDTGCPGPEITAWCNGPHGSGSAPQPEDDMFTDEDRNRLKAVEMLLVAQDRFLRGEGLPRWKKLLMSSTRNARRLDKIIAELDEEDLPA